MLRIRRFHRNDIAFAVRLSKREGWGIPPRDFQRIIDLNPRGSFVATIGGRRVGLATTTSFGKEVGWIGNVVVAREHRGKHIGQALMHEAVRYLMNEQVKRIVLYCYNENVQFYKRLGFIPGQRFVRLRREQRPAQGQVSFSASSKRLSLRSVLSEDRKIFGADRSRLMKCLLKLGHAWYLGYAAKSSLSYLLVKKYDDMNELGPWVSIGLRKEELDAMLKTVIARAGNKPMEVSCPLRHGRVLEIFRKHRFRIIERGRLMHYERIAELGSPNAIVALGFLDKG